jgi:RimJ/RimL family protein N-acetyltransferase
LQLRLVLSQDVIRLTALLKDADEDGSRVVQNLEDTEHTSYLVMEGEVCVGAVTMRWQLDESEIIYIVMDNAVRGRGYGKAAIALIISEARQHGTHSVIVGTANSSLDNIAFYQKCGFRMDTIRKDYFSYLLTPVYEYGILMRDMLLLRFDLTRDES